MGQILLIWGFPFYLILVEAGFRSITSIDVTSFVGPAIATAGLSLLLPLVFPKDVMHLFSEHMTRKLKENNVIVINRKDQNLIYVVWVAVAFGFLVWLYSSYTALIFPKESIGIIGMVVIPKHMAIGSVNYDCGSNFINNKKFGVNKWKVL